MFITLINDCSDDNAKARQTTRWATFFPNTNISFVSINSSLGVSATIEASGNLVDILDSSNGSSGIIALNVAPRGQVKIDGTNGSRFCYFYFHKTLVITTMKGFNLSLVKKFKITKYVNMLETEKVLDYEFGRNLVDHKLQNYIKKTQFRSLDFQPRVAKWIMDGESIPYTKLSIDEIPDPPKSVWYIDSFGNIKTTLTSHEVNSDLVKTSIGSFKYYDRLKDVPDGELAIYTGSSGIGDIRFLEIAVQNRPGSASAKLGIKVGDLIEIM